LIHSAPQRNAATLCKVLAPFLVSHLIAIGSCSFYLGVSLSDKNKYSTRACWISNNYNNFGATIISSAPSLYANLRVPTRVYDVEGGAIFSKNSTFVFFDGATWAPHLRSPSPIMAPGMIGNVELNLVAHPLYVRPETHKEWKRVTRVRCS